jgi:diguanylate cyclase (GGDEF)-like protein
MTAKSLKVLVVSGDRSLLRHLSRFLGAFAYEVQQAVDADLALRALREGDCDFLIIDAQPTMREALDLCRSVSETAQPRSVHTFLLVQDPDPQDLVDALEAGIDDFLQKPTVYGELLVRLRAGARTREFGRRLRKQDRFEPLSGLLSHSAFCRSVDRASTATDEGHPSGSCVVADADLLGPINAAEGRAAGDAVIRALADTLSALCEESDLLGCLGGGRFAVWLPEASEDAATEWAERARAQLEEAGITTGKGKLRFSASFGVAGREEGVGGSKELVQRALEALESAKSSGRNCVARFGQFDDESRAWDELTKPGKLFEGTLIRDVMTPCPLVLRSDETAAEARAVLRQTRLPVLPVVDEANKLAGIVSEANLADGPGGEDRLSRPLSQLMTTELASYDEDARFSELMEFFKYASSPLVVVVRNDWPTGLVTLKCLAAMSEPLDSDSFAPEGPNPGTSEYLLVNDSCLVIDD